VVAAATTFGTPAAFADDVARGRGDARTKSVSSAVELVSEIAAEAAEAEAESEGATDATILDEAWGLVFDNFLPARKSESDGFDRAAWEAIKAEHEANPPQSREEAYEMIKSMLGTLGDKFTRFIEPDRFTSMLKYDITGVGLNIAEDADDPERVRVLGMVLDSSAMKAGVAQDDEIVAVNGELVRGLSAFQVSSLIQEADGKSVDLTISRTGEDVPRVVSLTRDSQFEAPKSPVSMRLEGGHVGYIRLREFNSLAERDIARAITDLRTQGADAYILDLRDNPGGLVQAGVEIARLFLPADSTIAYTEGRVVAGGVKRDTDVSATKTARNGSDSQLPTKLKAITTSKNDPVVAADVPLVVLVNGRSASASEILTGALKDNCRATVVGSKTYGKGLIQSVYELSDLSGMVLTVGKYVTPGLVDIDQTGISPNFMMFPGFDAAAREIDACKVPPKY
jgi:C-terminal peptidase prc